MAALMTERQIEDVLSELYEEEKFTGPDRLVSHARLNDFFPTKESIVWLSSPSSDVDNEPLELIKVASHDYYNVDDLLVKLEKILRRGPKLLDTSGWNPVDVYKN